MAKQVVNNGKVQNHNPSTDFLSTYPLCRFECHTYSPTVKVREQGLRDIWESLSRSVAVIMVVITIVTVTTIIIAKWHSLQSLYDDVTLANSRIRASPFAVRGNGP